MTTIDVTPAVTRIRLRLTSPDRSGAPRRRDGCGCTLARLRSPPASCGATKGARRRSCRRLRMAGAIPRRAVVACSTIRPGRSTRYTSSSNSRAVRSSDRHLKYGLAVRIEVDRDLSDGRPSAAADPPRASQNSAEARFEVLRRIGLHDVVVCAVRRAIGRSPSRRPGRLRRQPAHRRPIGSCGAPRLRRGPGGRGRVPRRRTLPTPPPRHPTWRSRRRRPRGHALRADSTGTAGSADRLR